MFANKRFALGKIPTEVTQKFPFANSTYIGAASKSCFTEFFFIELTVASYVEECKEIKNCLLNLLVLEVRVIVYLQVCVLVQDLLCWVFLVLLCCCCLLCNL